MITAPKLWQPKVFFGGSISGCPDWQSYAEDLLLYNAESLNPRRSNFNIANPNVTEQQIKWEYRALSSADIILFWFCKETIGPIVLFELGRWSNTFKPIFVGIEPGYSRDQDVIQQLMLVRPEVKIANSLKDLMDQVNQHLIKNWPID